MPKTYTLDQLQDYQLKLANPGPLKGAYVITGPLVFAMIRWDKKYDNGIVSEKPPTFISGDEFFPARKGKRRFDPFMIIYGKNAKDRLYDFISQEKAAGPGARRSIKPKPYKKRSLSAVAKSRYMKDESGRWVTKKKGSLVSEKMISKYSLS